MKILKSISYKGLNWRPFLLLALSSFGLRLILAPFGTLQLDMNTFIAWSNILAQSGPAQFYTHWSDYLPGYLYILWLLGIVKANIPALGSEIVYVLYKLPAILADILTGAIIFWAVSKFEKRMALFASALYLFNPAVLANSTLWGQIDGISALTSLLTVVTAPVSIWVSAIALAAGTLVKPQAGFLAPLIGLWWLKRWGKVKTASAIVVCAAFFVLGFLPFAAQRPLFAFIQERLLITAQQYPYTSVNAFNFWALNSGWWKSDLEGAVNAQMIGIVLSVSVVIGAIVVFLKKRKESLALNSALAAAVLLGSFMFLTRMHERHMLAGFALLGVAMGEYPLLIIVWVVLSFTYLANLYFSYIWINENFRSVFSEQIVDLIVLINLASFVGLIVAIFWSKPVPFDRIKTWINEIWKNKVESGTVSFLENNARLALIIILSLAFVSRIISLYHPPDFYFDEVYHAFTAREMLNGNVKAWEWWNTPPPGVAYEWTHPPMAKLGMIAGMKILGQSAVGWRMPGAILGTVAVFLIYLIGKQLFKKETPALLSAAVFSLDGLPLVLSRIGMNDMYFVVSALVCIYLFLRERYFFSALALGFAAASKWTTLWVLPVLILAMLLFGKKSKAKLLWFLILVPAVYLASYLPFFTTGHTINQFLELQRQMWWYHTNLRATHEFQSSWWTWPFMIRPVWLFTQQEGNLVANIYAMGNPFVFWLGLSAILAAIVRGLQGKQAALIFIVAAWGAMFLPWAFSPRIMFLYHYLPAVPFLSLAAGWFLSLQEKHITLMIFVLFVLSFVFFYPHWTGILIPQWLDNLYYWFPSWKW